MTGCPGVAFAPPELVGLPLSQAEQRLNSSEVAYTVMIAAVPLQVGRKGGIYEFGEELRVVRVTPAAEGWRLLVVRAAHHVEQV